MPKIDQLHQILTSIPGSITRTKLIGKRKELQGKRKPNSGPSKTPAQNTDRTAPSEILAASPSIEPSADSLFDAALIDATNGSDINGLLKDYVNGGEPAVLKAGDRLSHNALVVVIFRMGDVCAIASKLQFWRKGRFDRVFLFKSLGSTDVTDEVAIAICGNDKDDRFSQFFFASRDAAPLKACLDLMADYPGSKLYLFAETGVPGWSVISGEDNWKTDGTIITTTPDT